MIPGKVTREVEVVRTGGGVIVLVAVETNGVIVLSLSVRSEFDIEKTDTGSEIQWKTYLVIVTVLVGVEEANMILGGPDVMLIVVVWGEGVIIDVKGFCGVFN